MSTPLFLFSPPRSGSTLLMRMLSKSPRIKFSGVTYEILKKSKEIYDLYFSIVASRPGVDGPIDDVIASEQHEAWLQTGTPESMKRCVRKMLMEWVGANEEDYDFWGLKEINIGYDGSPSIFNFLHEVMPDTKMIFLLRGQVRTLSSILSHKGWFDGWYGACPSNIEKMLKRHTSTILEYVENCPNEAYLVYYDDLIQDSFPSKFLDQIGVCIPQEVWEEQIKIFSK